MELTNDIVAALTLPPGKSDLICFDNSMPGFGIRLRAGGKRSWLIQYRVDGRQRRVTIADACKVNLKVAREHARKRFAEITLGRDPQAEKEAARAKAAVRIGPLITKYLALKKGMVRKNTYVADERYLNEYWKPLHNESVDAVSRRNIAARLSDISQEKGATAAARARQSLSAFFTWLMREGMAEANPVIGTNDPGRGIVARDRVLSNDEVVTIWNACRDDDFGRIVRLLMFTGCRRDEIGGLRWSEVDLERGLMAIPGDRIKNHHPLHLALPGAALSIFRGIPRKATRDFVFGGRGGAYSAWSYSSMALNGRIAEGGHKVAPWRLHDIRRTVATGMAEIGIQPHIIEAVLNHRSGHKAGVAGIYNRARYDSEVTRALSVWADHLLLIVNGCGSKIILLHDRQIHGDQATRAHLA